MPSHTILEQPLQKRLLGVEMADLAQPYHCSGKQHHHCDGVCWMLTRWLANRLYYSYVHHYVSIG
jgi:hypothetical protein